MAITLNSTDRANILQAITLLEVGTAPELVYPSGIHDDIVELVGRAADDSGFLSKGAFKGPDCKRAHHDPFEFHHRGSRFPKFAHRVCSRCAGHLFG
jgi:hypothetical protein